MNFEQFRSSVVLTDKEERNVVGGITCDEAREVIAWLKVNNPEQYEEIAYTFSAESSGGAGYNLQCD